MEAGLTAKNPSATYLVVGHVRNGCRTWWRSQFISTTKDVAVAKKRVEPGQVTVQITIGDDFEGTVTDLTDPAVRESYLKSPVSKAWAASTQEVLLT